MKKNEKVIVTFAILLLASSLFILPCASAIKPVSPAERVRSHLESGFNTWVTSKHMPLTRYSTATIFSQFLKERPAYQNELTRYINLTKPDLDEIMPLASDKKAPSSVETILVTNVTYNGVVVEANCSRETFPDGTSTIYIKLGCGDFDPWFAIEQHDIRIIIDGIPISVGRTAYLGMHFSPDEADDFIYDMTNKLTDDQFFVAVMGALFGLGVSLIALIPLPGMSIVAGTLVCMVGLFTAAEEMNIQALMNHLSNSVDENEGLYYCFCSTQALTIFGPADSFEIFVRHFYNEYDTWDLAYPCYSNSWTSGYLTYLGQALNAKVNDFVDAALDTGYYLNSSIADPHWYQCDATWPLPNLPDPPPGSSNGLVNDTVVCSDGSNSVNSNVYIDGHAAESLNSVYPLLPGSHSIGVDQYVPTSGGYGYSFDYMTIEGTNYYTNEATVQLSTNSAIEAHYTYGELPVYLLTVNAFDYYLGENYPYGVGVYLDSNYIGTSPVQTYVMAGSHTLSVDSPVYSEIWGVDAPFKDFTGDFDGWNLAYNPVTITIGMYSDSTINARYWPW